MEIISFDIVSLLLKIGSIISYLDTWKLFLTKLIQVIFKFNGSINNLFQKEVIGFLVMIKVMVNLTIIFNSFT